MAYPIQTMQSYARVNETRGFESSKICMHLLEAMVCCNKFLRATRIIRIFCYMRGSKSEVKDTHGTLYLWQNGLQTSTDFLPASDRMSLRGFQNGLCAGWTGHFCE